MEGDKDEYNMDRRWMKERVLKRNIWLSIETRPPYFFKRKSKKKGDKSRPLEGEVIKSGRCFSYFPQVGVFLGFVPSREITANMFCPFFDIATYQRFWSKEAPLRSKPRNKLG